MAFKRIEWTDDKKLSRKDLVDLMPFALENGRHEFISEFIEREDVVEEYLTVDELRRLYQKVLAKSADLNERTRVYRSIENRFDNIVLLQMPKNCIFRYLLKRRRSENRREYKRNMAQAEATSVRNPRLKEQPSFETTDNEQQEKFTSLKTRIKRAPFTLEEVRIALSREFSLNTLFASNIRSKFLQKASGAVSHCSCAQVGDCLIDLIGGSGGLPYVDDPRYNKRRGMIDDFVQTGGDAELALQEKKQEADLLHRMRLSVVSVCCQKIETCAIERR